jgi:hypothetical protein
MTTPNDVAYGRRDAPDRHLGVWPSRRPGIPRCVCVPMIPPSRGSASPAFDGNGSGAGQGTAGYGERGRPVGRGDGTRDQGWGRRRAGAGVVRGVGQYALGNGDGELFAVTRRCRRLGADLANGFSPTGRVGWSVRGMAPDTTLPRGG